MKGGSLNIKPIKNSNFKYTKQKQRIEWVKHIFPFGEYIIPLFAKIPWSEYKYEGPFRAWYYDDNDKYISAFEFQEWLDFFW